MMFRRGDESRSIFVPITLAFIILIAYFTGAFGYLNQIIFGARTLPDFAFGNSTSGVGIVALNLDNLGLQYFAGDKWKEIDYIKDYQFTLNSHVFEPKQVHKALYDFYATIERRPTEFQVSVNDWRYWKVSPFSPSGSPVLFPQILFPVTSLTKSGFADADFKNIANIDIYNNFFYSSGGPADKIFSQEKGSQAYLSAIAWRDSILAGQSCEKFLTINTFQKVGDANTPLSSLPKTYTVRKVDQYLFIELDRPVLDTSDEKWKKQDCFKVEQYDDTLVDRSDWKNDAKVEIYYDAKKKVNDWEKLWWIPQKGWGYQTSDVNQGNIVYASDRIDSQEKFRNLLNGKSFYEGLVAITLPKGYLYGRHASFTDGNKGVYVAGSKESLKIDFVKGKEWEEWKEDRETIVNRFNYLVLDEYNKHLLPKFYFEKSSDGIQRLQKREITSSGTFSAYVAVYLKDGFLYYTVTIKSIPEGLPVLGDSYIIGSVENGLFSVSDMDTFDELKISYPNLDKLNYDLTVQGLNYLRGKNVKSIVVKEVQS